MKVVRVTLNDGSDFYVTSREDAKSAELITMSPREFYRIPTDENATLNFDQSTVRGPVKAKKASK